MHNLVELWPLPAIFFSKIFDQVGGSGWSADLGLFSFDVGEMGLQNDAWRKRKKKKAFQN